MLDGTADLGDGAGLSVSMIVRNEGHRLSACIASIAPVANEVCIADTGSTDNTVAVAESLGCQVIHIPWCDDFSAARNGALALCRFSWVLSLDADEIVAQADHDALRAIILESPQCAYRFVTRNYTNDTTVSGYEPSLPDTPHSKGFSGWYPSVKVRLFPNIDGVRFDGVVHELPNASLIHSGIDIRDASILIHHYPDLNVRDGAQKAKQQLYLALGEKKVAEDPSNAKAHSELGDQQVDMGDYAAAVTSYKMAVALEPTEGRWLKNMGAALFLLGHYPQALRALRLAVSRDPSLEEGWRNFGVVLIQQGDYREACDALEHALALNDEHPDNLRYLAIAQSRCGDETGAMATLERLFQCFPEHAEGRALYANLSAAQDKA